MLTNPGLLIFKKSEFRKPKPNYREVVFHEGKLSNVTFKVFGWLMTCKFFSVEVILRAEAVETAQAGDKCDFTGTLIVVPDVGSISLPGARAESSARKPGEGPESEGVRGLKNLGVRDLNYRLAFLACSVTQSNPMVGHMTSTSLFSNNLPRLDVFFISLVARTYIKRKWQL